MHDTIDVVRMRRGKPSVRVSDSVVCEHRLAIHLGGAPWRECVCSPGALEDLVSGVLRTSGFDEAAAGEFIFNADRSVVNVTLPGGACPRAPSPLPIRQWREEEVWAMEETFSRDGDDHRQTGGVHGAVLVADGKTYRAADISRHSAIDKAVGAAARDGAALDRAGLYTSGRAPGDIVLKAVTAGIPLLCARKAPTDRGVALARKYGLHLFCYVRDGRCTFYGGDAP